MGGLTLLGVEVADRLDGIGANLVKVSRGTSREAAQVKAGHPFALDIRAGGRLEAGLIAVVEHLVHFCCCGVEPPIGFSTDLQSKSAREQKRHERIIALHGRSCSTQWRNSLVGRDIRVALLLSNLFQDARRRLFRAPAARALTLRARQQRLDLAPYAK